MRSRIRLAVAGVLLGVLATWPADRSRARGDEPPRIPTVFLVGDSTVKNGADAGSGRLRGWGHYLGEHIDPARYRVENRALGGRSSRTYRTEGLWAAVVARLRPGDFVLIQFGHNDGGPIDSGRARASLRGAGAETREVRVADRPPEVVHTYGWYLGRYVAEARERGATPVVLSPVPRNRWGDDGRVLRASGDYGLWAAAVARAEGAPFVDLNAIVADRYERVGRERVGREEFTPADHTHTTEAGARRNAACVAAGLRDLPALPLAAAILPRRPDED